MVVHELMTLDSATGFFKCIPEDRAYHTSSTHTTPSQAEVDDSVT